MADAVTSQTIINGQRNLVMKFTNLSDGTGESLVKKVDAQSLTFAVNMQGQQFVPGVHLKIVQVDYDIKGMELRIQWDATTPTDIFLLGGTGLHTDKDFGGAVNPAATGATGSILFTTVNAALNASYSVILRMTKNVPVS